MPSATISDRTATRAEVLKVREQLRELAAAHDVTDARVDTTGTVIVGSDAAGYGPLRRFANAASNVIGVWVNVITDDVPDAEAPAEHL